MPCANDHCACRQQPKVLPEPYSHVTPFDYWLYTTPDEEAPESEVIELITAFVRALKPQVVVETGTAEGHTAEAIARALAKNGRGTLYTVEIDKAKVDRCRQRLAGLPAEVIFSAAQSVDPSSFGYIDLLYIDGHLEERANEYRHFDPYLRSGGIALLHDTLKFDPPKTAVQELLGQQVCLSTPRGLTILQKP